MSEKPQLKWVTIISGAATVSIAFFGLLGYVPGWSRLSSIFPNCIPMAPATAVSFLILGAILLRWAFAPFPRPAPAAVALATLVSIFGILELGKYFTGLDLTFEDALLPNAGKLGSIPLARMSPSTAANFFLAGTAVVLLALRSRFAAFKSFLGNAAGFLASMVLTVGITFVLGYLYGKPLMYGKGSTVPMALTTAAAFLFLGTAVMAQAGRDCFPLELVTGPSTRPRLMRVFLPLAVLAVIFQGVLARFVYGFFGMHQALLSSAAVVAVALLTGLVVWQMAGRIGMEIDLAEAERKRAEERQQLMIRVLELVNSSEPNIDRIRSLLLLAKQFTGIEAVGIRLKQGEDYPYYETNGFSENFVAKENYLCARDAAGETIRDSAGEPYLECMCGNIISRRTDPSHPFFTKGGSFWTNSTTELLASTPEKDRQTWTRNRCNSAGYESVALIPLRSGAEIVGLLQLNDKRKDRFSLELIEFFEGIGASIGIALKRKRAEDELRESEERYATLFRNAAEGILVADMETKRFVYANPAICRMLGYSEEEIKRLGVLDIHPAESREHVLADFEAQALGKKALLPEFPCRRKDGSVIYAEITASGMILNKRHCSVGFFSDVTERKRAEEELRESEERYATLFRNAAEGILVADLETKRFVYANPAICRMLGYSEEEMKRLGVQDIHPAESLEHVLGEFEAQALGKKALSPELPCRRKDGSVIYADITASGMILNNRHYNVGFFSDVTERKRAEAELRQHREQLEELVQARTLELEQKNALLKIKINERRVAEERNLKLAAIVDSSDDAIIGLNLEGAITSWNRGAEQIYGYSEREMLDQPLLTIVPPERKDEIPDILALIRQGERIERLETERLRKDGKTIQVSLTISPVRDTEGRIVGASSIAHDITERKQAEEELKQAKAAADFANKAKSIFLANMSHEIRTPLNAILGFSQLLLRGKSLEPKQKHFLDTINQSGESLLSLINDILEMSKIEAGRITLSPCTFDLYALLTDLELMFKPRAEDKKLALLLEQRIELPRYVVGDENKLRQIFINLLSNAVKFTDQGGIAVRVGSRPGEGTKFWLQAEIEDTGVGIAAEELGNLFKPFRQVGKGRRIEGTGLGLTISREFARLMGGEISVKSEPGKGSLFRFDLVLDQANVSSVAKARPLPRVLRIKPGQPPYRILAADDKKDNRELLSQLLSLVGFSVHMVANGEQALRDFKAWHPHLILMDMRMPVMDGYEAIRMVRSLDEGKSVKIIGVSASAFEENRKEVLAAGADEFIAKPFRDAEIYGKIGSLLGVEYEYEDLEAADDAAAEAEEIFKLTFESLSALPAELLHRLRRATVNADLDRMLELIAEVEATDAHAARQLRKLAEQFEYQKLLDLLPKERRS